MELEPWDPLDHPARIEVRRQESDDSDAEGGLGNVTRVVLRPPGHSGKAKRGHLCFDASYECGNLGRVDFISEHEYDLFIRPDTCNPRYRLWFNFVVDNVRADQRVIFNIVNLCKIKTLFRDGMTPLVKTSSRPKWQRLPGKYVYYHKSPEHRNHYVLSFAFAFDREEDVYQFAFSFPFSYSRCQAHLELIEEKELPFVKRETICLSLQNRKLDVITIFNSSSAALAPAKKPKLIVLIARSHPGETPTSFVLQGLIDFLVSVHAIAAALRDHVIFKIVPMLNPDGVFLGNYRCSLMGYDLNRHWNQVSPWAHPTLNAIKNYLLDLDASKNFELDMVIDLHAHSSLMGCFIYGNSYDDVYRFERHILFPKLLAHNAEDFNANHTMYNRDPNKSGSARRHLCEILRNTVNVYTLEVSFLGYQQAVTSNPVTYNEDGYFRLGRNLARTFFEYYRVTGIIPANILPGPTSKENQEAADKKSLQHQRRSRSRSASQPRGKSSKLKMMKQAGISGGSESKLMSNVSTDEKYVEGKTEKNTSRRSLSQEKAVVELSQLTIEKVREDGDEGDLSDWSDGGSLCTEHQPHKQRYEHNQQLRRSGHSSLPPDTSNSLQQNDKFSLTSNPRMQADSKERFISESPTRKSVEAHTQQLREQTAVYKTFDFSVIRATHHGKRYPKHKRPNATSKRCGPSTGRKIGGGGIIGKKHTNRGQKEGGSGWVSEPETDVPCLSIIDFNLLIRPGLEGHERGAWRGLKKTFHSKNESTSSRTKSRLKTRLPFDSDDKGKSDEGEHLGRRKYSHSRYVRQRKAVLFRGTVTDCSPWEESADQAGSDDSTVSEPVRSRKSLLFQANPTGKRLTTKERLRTCSPLTSILLTI